MTNLNHDATGKEQWINQLYPFYILLDQRLDIKRLGNSLGKILSMEEMALSFTDQFEISRPLHDHNLLSFEFLQELQNKSVILFSKHYGFRLKGQFIQLDLNSKNIFFLGSPIMG